MSIARGCGMLGPMARILIVGCGYVGAELGGVLLTAGHEVWGMRRDATSLPQGIHALRADVTRRDGLAALPERIDFVVYAVGAKARDEQSYRAIYLDGLGNLLSALADEGQRPRRIFFTSSTAVYSQARGEWVDECSPTHPSGFAGEILLAAERLLQASPVPSSVVRLGGIYGPGRTSLIERVQSGEPAPVRDDVHYTNRIHRDDAARAIAHLIALARPAALYLGVDCEPVSEGELWRWLAQQLGVAPRETAERSVAPRRAGSKRCRNDLLLASGFRFRHATFREGYGELIRAATIRDRT